MPAMVAGLLLCSGPPGSAPCRSAVVGGAPSMTCDLLGAALALAGGGCHVFPVRPGGKAPATAHGVLDATGDLERIAGWWRRWPAANVGVACGPSALAVVDLDGPEAVAGWMALLDRHPGTPRAVKVRTPREGGWHLWYATRPDRPLRNSASRLAVKVDTRGAGGYVIAPPSMRPDGAYRWAAGLAPDLHRLPLLPGWVLDLLEPPRAEPATAARPWHVSAGAGGSRYAVGAVEGEVQAVLDAPAGTRNWQLNRSAFNLGTLVGAGLLDRAEATRALTLAGQAAGLHAREVSGSDGRSGTVASGLAAGIARPRQVSR